MLRWLHCLLVLLVLASPPLSAVRCGLCCFERAEGAGSAAALSSAKEIESGKRAPGTQRCCAKAKGMPKGVEPAAAVRAGRVEEAPGPCDCGTIELAKERGMDAARPVDLGPAPGRVPAVAAAIVEPCGTRRVHTGGPPPRPPVPLTLRC